MKMFWKDLLTSYLLKRNASINELTAFYTWAFLRSNEVLFVQFQLSPLENPARYILVKIKTILGNFRFILILFGFLQIISIFIFIKLSYVI